MVALYCETTETALHTPVHHREIMLILPVLRPS